MIKLNKDIIYHITDELDEKVGFFLNCKTNEIYKLDSIAVDYFYEILNATNKEDVKEYLNYFKGVDIFE